THSDLRASYAAQVSSREFRGGRCGRMGGKGKSKLRQDAIKPALAFFLGLGTVFLLLHFAWRGRKPLGQVPSQAQTALASLGTALDAVGEGFSEVPKLFQSFHGPTERQLRHGKFVMSEPNSLDCPAGSVKLDEPEACEIASEVLKLRYNPDDQRVSGDPKGCQFRVPDKDMYFNSEE
ncbi:unnamed protein product, partial [Effrenium voratum]